MHSTLKKVDAHAASGLGPLPIDMALNHGTWASPRCVDVMKRYDGITSFRIYPSSDNLDLRQAIARCDGVKPENVFVANGSGPLLKTCVPHVIEKKIKSSVKRMAKHLISREGFPITTPWLTYSKVPGQALKHGLKVNFLPLEPSRGFKLDIGDIEAALSRGDGFVYIVNPNNPTGNALVTRDEMIPLFKRYPETIFAIDEAYVQYLDPADHTYFSDLVGEYPNLMVLRSFSFAYGLATARVGYILANKDWVAEWETKMTTHRVGQISAELAMVSMEDKEHLRFVRREMAVQRQFLMDVFRRYEGVEVFDSQVNYFLCRFTDGRTGRSFYNAMLERGIKIKIFENVLGQSYDPWFRVTVGLAEENQFTAEQADALLLR